MSDAESGPPQAPTAVGPSAGSSKADQAEHLIKRYMAVALGVALIPVPLLDMAALTGVQLKLLSRLAKLYGVDFSTQRGKAAVGSLVGGGGSTLAAVTSRRLIGGLVAAIPGWLLGATSMAVFAGGSTYALGRVFVQHFDSGGTFLTFDPEKVRRYYAENLVQGQAEVTSSFAGVQP